MISVADLIQLLILLAIVAPFILGLAIKVARLETRTESVAELRPILDDLRLVVNRLVVLEETRSKEGKDEQS